MLGSCLVHLYNDIFFVLSLFCCVSKMCFAKDSNTQYICSIIFCSWMLKNLIFRRLLCPHLRAFCMRYYYWYLGEVFGVKIFLRVNWKWKCFDVEISNAIIWHFWCRFLRNCIEYQQGRIKPGKMGSVTEEPLLIVFFKIKSSFLQVWHLKTESNLASTNKLCTGRVVQMH